MTRTVRQLLQLCHDLGIEVPEGGLKLERCYAKQCGYSEGWSWVIRDQDTEWLASQWGAKDLIEAHKDGRVSVFSDDAQYELHLGPADMRTSALTHYGQSRPFGGCHKGMLDQDTLSMDHGAITCPDCRKTVRKSQKSMELAAERERRHQEYQDELTPEQRAVRDRFWGIPK